MSIGKTAATLIALIALSIGGAHATEGKPKHGGQLVGAGEYHVEAVAKGTTIEVYISDHDDKPISTKGFKATAILIVGGKPQRIPLSPKDINALVGTSPVELTGPIKGTIQIITAKNETVQAKF